MKFLDKVYVANFFSNAMYSKGTLFASGKNLLGL